MSLLYHKKRIFSIRNLFYFHSSPIQKSVDIVYKKRDEANGYRYISRVAGARHYPQHYENDIIIKDTDDSHSISSAFEKYLIFSLNQDIVISQKSIRIHVFKNLTTCTRMLLHLTTRWQLFNYFCLLYHGKMQISTLKTYSFSEIIPFI